jgi:hypothetical protein
VDDDPRQSNDIPHRIRQSILEDVHAGSIIGNITQSINPSQLSPNPTAQQPIVLSASIMASAALCSLVCGAPEEMRGKAFGRK